MLADPARIRLIVVGGAILAAAVILRLVTGSDAEPAPPSSAPVTASDDQAAEPDDRGPAADPGDQVGDEEDLDQAHAAAAAFAEEYLTWVGDESTADRAVRIGDHASRSFAAQLADAQTSGAADTDDDAQVDQTVQVLDTQTTTTRAHHLEVAVMAEATATDADEPVPTNLTVVLRQEAGRWVVDDLR